MWTRRSIRVLLAGLTVLLANSCSLPRFDSWRKGATLQPIRCRHAVGHRFENVVPYAAVVKSLAGGDLTTATYGTAERL